MDDLALHASTKASIKNYLLNPAHALCLIGPPGAGKSFTAQRLAMHVLMSPKTESILTIAGQDASIGIEQIRSMQQFLRLKKPGQALLKRAIIIENAETMSDEAQNALLKTLEEPPADTVFILTSDGSAILKPTIYSRVQKIYILPLSLREAELAFDKGKGELTKAYYLSGGYVGLLYALMNDPAHELVSAVDKAKFIMQAKPFDRQAMVDSLAKQKENLPLLVYALQRVLGAVLVKTHGKVQLSRLTASSRALYEAERDLQRNANPKLLLCDLFLQI